MELRVSNATRETRVAIDKDFRSSGVVEELERSAAEALEEQVAERTAKLQETIADLEAFSYSVSHDLRTHVGTLRGLALLLQRDSAGQINDKGKRYLDGIIATAGRMDRFIEDILILSRVARDDSNLQPLDVERIVRSVIGSSPAFQPPRAEIQLRAPLPLVLGHETALTQCISNLLSNAVKFVAPGTLPRIRVWVERRPEYVRLWFCDNGIGIAPRDHTQLFGAFQRLDSSYEGTGLGLAIVKRAAERMGGCVGVESELGKGSRFWVHLKSADQVVPQPACGILWKMGQ